MNNQYINVRYDARDINYKLLFQPAGETAWSFTAESDGEIYAVESNNVASYTINGRSVTLPFALNAGNSYAIVITKTNAGQAADITFKSRRVNEKTIIQNVPDFQSGNGRYWYVLHSLDNKVSVLDSDLIKPSNYLGSGNFITSPIIKTISLPPLPIDFYFRDLFFAKNGNIYLLTANKYGFKIFGCKIMPDNNVYDFDNNIDSVTEINVGANGDGSTSLLIYDYVANYAYQIPQGYGFDVDTETSTTIPVISNNMKSLLPSGFINSYMLIPELQRFPVINTDVSIREDAGMNNKAPYNKQVYTFIYNRNTGYTIGPTYYRFSALEAFDSNGTLVAVSNAWSSVAGIRTMAYSSIIDRMIFASTNLELRICNGQFGNSFFYTISNTALNETSIKRLCPSNFSNLFAALGYGGDGEKRVHFIDPFNEVSPELAYVDLLYNTTNVISNQLSI